MIARRDVLKLAASLTAATPLAPFAVSPERAAALLRQPAEFTVDQAGPATPRFPESDVVGFADDLDGTDWFQWFEYGAAEEMALYKQALSRCLDHFGVADLGDLDCDHPVSRLDDATLRLWCRSWRAGVRAGAGYEHLRLALITPRQMCRICHGEGRTWGGKHYPRSGEEAVCTNCAGIGTVATPPAALSFDV